MCQLQLGFLYYQACSWLKQSDQAQRGTVFLLGCARLCRRYSSSLGTYGLGGLSSLRTVKNQSILSMRELDNIPASLSTPALSKQNKRLRPETSRSDQFRWMQVGLEPEADAEQEVTLFNISQGNDIPFLSLCWNEGPVFLFGDNWCLQGSRIFEVREMCCPANRCWNTWMAMD